MSGAIEPHSGAGAARNAPLVATVALALGLQVQFVAPIGGGLKLAASDLVAVGVAAWAGLALVRGRRFMSLSPGRLILAFGAMAAALAVGALVAAGTLGHVPIWAWAGRGLGLGLLATYLVAAAYLCSGTAQACGHARAASVFVIVTATITAAAATPTLVFGLTGWWFGVARPYEALSGFVENRNAFSLILLAALALLFAAYRLRPERFGALATAALLAILSLALLFAGSRAALPIAAVMVVAALGFRWLGLRPVLTAAGAVAVYVAAAWLTAMAWSPSGGTGGLEIVAPSTVGGENDPSNIERWRSFGEAWRLFLSRPLTGIGLGAFAEHQAATHGRALVVHNSALWILTEMGLVGVLCFGLAAILLLAPVATAAARSEARVIRHAVLLFLVAAAAMSLVHEMLYQRVIWVMLGLGLAAELPDRAVRGPPSA